MLLCFCVGILAPRRGRCDNNATKQILKQPNNNKQDVGKNGKREEGGAVSVLVGCVLKVTDIDTYVCLYVDALQASASAARTLLLPHRLKRRVAKCIANCMHK